ncbi:uncharacterized protein GGS22DRAFT_104567 [Annulohypoxylon maeteangense]|uniref:uncharacterized protein n=1 Tax=Annulohypoxylon maeteangense TaxID=1927788 RepID=UPI0020083055|nr:uncharacterized protein GGS22DRAFT_104567 [Annulohypoxylon maeteangense]KAI0887114.1 hypothetical protein GGS22DRAFT_104567 [Annulohypoxylon maeteangense]
MDGLKSILRKPTMDESHTETEAASPRRISVSFGDVLARDVEGGAVVPSSTRSRVEWMQEVNARRGADLIEKFRDAQGARACCVGVGESAGREVVLYALAEGEGEDDSGSETEDEDEDEDEDGDEDEVIEVVFERDSDDDGDDADDNDDDDDDDDDDDEKSEDEEKKDETKGEKDSMEYARTFLQSEIGSRCPMVY